MIPDVYGHGDACQKCQPLITGKETIIEAGLAYQNKDFNRAAELYIKGASEPLKLNDGSYKSSYKGHL